MGLLVEDYPNIAAQWHPTKNDHIDLYKITSGSGKKVWWECEKEHQWEATVGSRTNLKSKCPLCSKIKAANKLMLPAGKLNLQESEPQVAAQWHPTKNDDLTPEKLTRGSERKVWWQCKEGHEWESSPYKRCVRKQNCPTCAGRVVLVGFNDFATEFPDLTNEWHVFRNAKRPNEIPSYARYKAWWVCAKGHQWEAYVYARTRKKGGSGCPACTHRVSRAEKELQHFFNEQKIPFISNQRVIPPYELDLFFPTKQVAVEFNGLYWHSEQNGKHKWYHYDKWETCKNKGIQLIQIWEDDWNRNIAKTKEEILDVLGKTFNEPLSDDYLIKKISQNEAEKFYETILYKFSDAKDFLTNKELTHYGVENISTQTSVAVMTVAYEEFKTFVHCYRTNMRLGFGFADLIQVISERKKEINVLIPNCSVENILYAEEGFIEKTHLQPESSFLEKNQRSLIGSKDSFLVWDAGRTLYVKQT